MNPYHDFVAEFTQLTKHGKSLPLGGLDPAPRPILAHDAPKVLIFAPHPDDECIIGGLPLRLLREAKMNVINVAVTQGSKKERQTERYFELQKACHYLGFGLMQTAPGGLERINLKTREHDPAHWDTCVAVIADLLRGQRPHLIFFPHEHDWNSSHIGTHFLVLDALLRQANDFTCHLVETEFWGQMTTPNLMVESSTQDVADLVAGTSFHVGEVKRNPYHVLLPAWMLDNVRRGSELVGGQGQPAPDFTFATLYRLRRWVGGTIQDVQVAKRQLSIG
ncbi:MAG: PIG-L family deacetylase, partial [Verrucomicrobiales bacterium]|nr:PIG-L family deacetylase [Verrucomicrobiales bacterium]